MVVVLTIKEIKYLVVGLFDDLVGPISYIFVILGSLAALNALIRP